MGVIDLTTVKKEGKAGSAELEGAIEDPKAQSTKEVVIRLDGPLASIYAQALNVLYAKEAMADGSANTLTMIDSLNSEEVNPDLYVYATDSDHIGSDSVTRQFDKLRIALDKHKATKTMVVLENVLPKGAIAALESFAYDVASKVCYQRKIALEVIYSYLKGR